MNAPTTSHYPTAPTEQRAETHTLSVLVDNEPGVLARVIGLFSGRGYNIESLTVSETEHAKHQSLITVVTTGTPMVIEQIKNQLDRLVPIHRVIDMTLAGNSIERELAMVKVRGQGRAARRGAAAGRCLPRPRHRRHHRELRVRDHRRLEQDRAVRGADAAARPGRGGAHRHCGDPAGAGGAVMPLDLLLALTVFACVMAFTPGPNNIMLAASGVNFGFAHTIPHMLGVAIGFDVLLVACAAGLGLVFAAVPQLHLAAQDRRRALHALARLEGRHRARRPAMRAAGRRGPSPSCRRRRSSGSIPRRWWPR